MSDDAPRFLNFDHAGVSYLVIARPGAQGVDLSLERGGVYWRGFGFVPYDAIAAGAGRGLDPVDERMGQIRDAVFMGDVS